MMKKAPKELPAIIYQSCWCLNADKKLNCHRRIVGKGYCTAMDKAVEEQLPEGINSAIDEPRNVATDCLDWDPSANIHGEGVVLAKVILDEEERV
jgi:hypothetical protein